MNQAGVWYSINECATSQALTGRSSALWRIHTVIKAMSECIHGEFDDKLVLVIEDCGCLSEDLYGVVSDLFLEESVFTDLMVDVENGSLDATFVEQSVT